MDLSLLAVDNLSTIDKVAHVDSPSILYHLIVLPLLISCGAQFFSRSAGALRKK